MADVLVTGGTGFVGSWMEKTQPREVKAIYLHRHNHLEYMFADLQYSAVVHLANIDPVNVIQIAKEQNIRLLYCSSGAAYDQHTEYADNKRKRERQCLESGVDVVIARLFTFYDSARSHVAFVKAAKANEPLIITGNGMTTRSYMRGDELGHWMWRILLHGKSGEIYDVGSHIPVTMLELAQYVVKKYNSKSQIIIQNGKDDVPYYVPRNMQKTLKLW